MLLHEALHLAWHQGRCCCRNQLLPSPTSQRHQHAPPPVQLYVAGRTAQQRSIIWHIQLVLIVCRLKQPAKDSSSKSQQQQQQQVAARTSVVCPVLAALAARSAASSSSSSLPIAFGYGWLCAVETPRDQMICCCFFCLPLPMLSLLLLFCNE